MSTDAKPKPEVTPDPTGPGVPPDGGIRAYTVVLASFITNGLLFGVINSYSVIYNVLEKRLNAQHVSNAEGRAALVGSLAFGTTFFLSPVSGVLTGILGLRKTAMLGGTIATTGMILSSFFIDNVNILMFTYGIMYGTGASFAYTPSLAVLAHYFRKRLGVVNGFVTTGSSTFTLIIPPMMDYVIKHHGLEWLLRVFACFAFGLGLCGLLFKPMPGMMVRPKRKDDSFKSFLKTIINTDIWKSKKYTAWALSMPIALFGYFVPYVHIKKFIEDRFTNVNMNLPLQSIAFTSAIGRFGFGYLADRPRVNRILLQQISFYAIGTFTIILPFVNKFMALVGITLCMGLFDGAFIALVGPIAIELCGGQNAAQAIGCMLGLTATPLSLGPSIAGAIYKVYNDYTIPFICAGLSPILGATLMFLTRLHPTHPKVQEDTTPPPPVVASPVPTVPTAVQIDEPHE